MKKSTKKGDDDALVFRGTPVSLAAIAPPVADARGAERAMAREAPAREGRVARASFAAPGETARVLQVSASAAGDRDVLRTFVPRATAPGRYEGTVTVDGVERTAIFQVEPEPFLRIVPDRLQLSAAAGERLTRRLTILNLGNVAVEVRGAYAFGLFDVGGVERAVARTIGGEGGEGGEGRSADRFVGMLADEHGGMVRVRVEEGAGNVEPGETRDLTVAFHLPDRLRAGHTYWGTWPIEYLRYYVRVHTTRGEAREESTG